MRATGCGVDRRFGLAARARPGDTGRRRLAWCAAAALVMVGWLVTPHPVALYDGVGLPDEPYRFVTTPAGATARVAPTGGSMSMAVSDGTNRSDINVTTRESGPQATADFPQGSVAAQAGPVVVTLTPLAPTDQPVGTPVDGNVYQVDVTSPAGPVNFTAAAVDATVSLRAPQAGPRETMLYRPGTGQPWKALQTAQVGREVWAASLPGLGQYALAQDRPGSGGPAAAGPGGARDGAGGLPVLAIALGGGVLVLLGVVAVVRRRSPTSGW